ncbi:SdpI family protein [Halorubrum sp. CSM-61]|uniref:SdpI family protein n=1 Tax=Halorubrum sp. CSM-61 TaxID=2485838 RepID=UPI000F4BFB32|nr:SdpI family protein [Halorubrum sp. CSM-61]
MRSVQRLSAAAGIVLIAAALSAVAAPSIPERAVTTWDAAGRPAGTLPRAVAVWLPPALMAGLVLLLAALPRVDPLRENVAAFRPTYDWFVVALTAFLFVVHAGILAFNLGYEFPFTSLLVAAVSLLVYYVGAVLPKTERNWLMGIRTPWTLSSDAVWDRTHRLGGRLFKLAALVGLAGLAFGEYAVYLLVGPVVAAAVVSAAYSYVAYSRLEEGVDGSVGPRSGT